MIRLLYSSLFALCLPFVFLKLLWRGYKAPEYKARRFERFGLFKKPDVDNSIWFHTVSVGELLAAEPIIRQVQRQYPDRQLVVTTMTPTSSALLYKLFGDSVFHVYAPYDFPLCVRAFLKRIKPSCLVIMETELWPNTIHLTSQRGCPVVVANARLSERSAKGYLRLRPMIGWMLNGLSLVLCQHENDAKRFASLGIDESKIKVTGSVKYDIELAQDVHEKGAGLRQSLVSEQKIWIAASTHEGEDQKVLDVYRRLRDSFPDLVLVIVPRHPERFDSAVALAEQEGFRVFRRTEHAFIPAETEVFVVDTMGELMPFYAASDIAFIGGSLVEVGGHNPIEPAVLNRPSLIGPNYFNFEAICRQLEEAGGMQIVADEEALLRSLEALLSDRAEMTEMGLRAGAIVAQGKGAVERVSEELMPLIDTVR